MRTSEYSCGYINVRRQMYQEKKKRPSSKSLSVSAISRIHTYIPNQRHDGGGATIQGLPLAYIQHFTVHATADTRHCFVGARVKTRVLHQVMVHEFLTGYRMYVYTILNKNEMNEDVYIQFI